MCAVLTVQLWMVSLQSLLGKMDLVDALQGTLVKHNLPVTESDYSRLVEALSMQHCSACTCMHIGRMLLSYTLYALMYTSGAEPHGARTARTLGSVLSLRT